MNGLTLYVRVTLTPPVYFEGVLLPGFPSDTVQTNTTGQSGPATLKEAFIFYQDCKTAFSRYGASLEEEGAALLDFGSGWGRIARFFVRELGYENIYGLDVMDEYVKICNDTFRSKNFTLTSPFPPTRFEDACFTHIVGYSVFSHLSEKACMQWMQEFHRLLPPGGMVALTTRGRPFFDYCQSLSGKGFTGHAGALATIFGDFNAARARYDEGEFVHSNVKGVTGGGAMNSTFYGETFIPEAYAAEAYKDWFVLEEFAFDSTKQSHPIMFFRRI